MTKIKDFECLDCDIEFSTDDYWWTNDFTDNGTEELAQSSCPDCDNEVLED